MSGRFQDFDHFNSVLQSRGLDLSDRDKNGIPKKVSLRDWLDAGKEQLKEVIGSGVKLQDTISTPDITPWLPQVIERNVMEAVEPLLVLTSLFEKMSYEPGQILEFPAVGAVSAADIAELESYPLVRLQESGATVTAKTGKSGIAFEISEEAQMRSKYDLIGMHTRACGRALARHKEVKAANFLLNMGVVAFDNRTPTSSMFGVTTGRGFDGTANGSMILDNLFDTFSLVMAQGFMPNTLIMNPMTYVMFLKDEVLRAITLAGGNQVWYASWRGTPVRLGPGSRTGVSGGRAIVPGSAASGETATATRDYPQDVDSAPILPGRWPFPLRIVVSPFIPFDAPTKRTDIIVCDGSELGFYIEEHGVKVQEWQDLAIDSTKYKLKERYCFHVANEGLAIAVMKNVRVVPNEINLPAQVTHAVSGSLQPIPATTPV
jgi:hypothetical protein